MLPEQEPARSLSRGYHEYGQLHWPAAIVLWRLGRKRVAMLAAALVVLPVLMRYEVVGDHTRCCLVGLWSAVAAFCLVHLARHLASKLTSRGDDKKSHSTNCTRHGSTRAFLGFTFGVGLLSIVLCEKACFFCSNSMSETLDLKSSSLHQQGQLRMMLQHKSSSGSLIGANGEVGHHFTPSQGQAVQFCPADYYPTETRDGELLTCVRECPLSYSNVVKDLHSRSNCANDDQRELVTMIWTTSADSFGVRNQWTVESLFKHHPCARIQVLSNKLPTDFFDTFRYEYGFSIQVVRYDLQLGGALVGPPGGPGTKWIAEMEKWRKLSTAFHVHLSDMLRLFVLYRYGGTYVDFDHIVLKPMHLLPPNTIGSEICHNDNPDCLTSTQLSQLRVINVADLRQVGRPGSRMSFDDGKRYTPCNGVMVNWVPQNPLITAALQHADEHYNPKCWGCLGPRLFGRLLLSSLSSRPLSVAALSMEPPARFYPFSYETVATHLSTYVDETELLLAAEGVMGAHFFGKVSGDVALHVQSTMGQIVKTYTLFGMHKWEWVVRKQNVKTCTISAVGASKLAAHSAEWIRRHEIKVRAMFDIFPYDITEFASVASASSVMLICHPEWLGIREMTERIGVARGLPVIMPKSKGFFHEDSKRLLCQILSRFQITSVSMQGVPEGALPLIEEISTDDCGDRKSLAFHDIPWADNFERWTSVVYHSGIAVHNVAVPEAVLLGVLFKGAKQSRISLNFIEDDQTKYARALGIPACTLWPTFTAGRGISHPHIDEGTNKKALVKENKLNLGLLGYTRLAVKNFFPQLGAACMFEDSLIHVTSLENIPIQVRDSWHLSFCNGRIIEHGELSPTAFAVELGKTDINFYVTWTDAVPNVVLDSLAMGVPVIVSDTTPIFRFSSFLHELLVVNRVDDPAAIFERANNVLAYVRENPEDFAKHVDKLLRELDQQAHKSWDCFQSSSIRVPMCLNQDGKCEPNSVPQRSRRPKL